MPTQPVDNQRHYRHIADQISGLIASGEFGQATRLPSERDLAVQLGVSRPSVREALIALEVEGRVHVRVGSGIYVTRRRPVAAVAPGGQGQGRFELLRARCLVEGEIAAEAARKATVQDLPRVRSAIEDVQRRDRQRLDLGPADRDFHLAVARASHNSALLSVIRDLWDQERRATWKRSEHHFHPAELRVAVLRDHRVIFEALKARDPRTARTAMRRHVEGIDRELAALGAREGH